MRERFTEHWYNHKFKYASTFAMTGLLVIGSLINMSLIRGHLDRNYSRTFETFSFDSLSTYHNSNVSLINSFYTHNLESITNLANAPEILSSLDTGSYSDAQDELDSLSEHSINFNTITLIDKSGIVRAISSDFNNIQRFIGTDVSDTAVIKKIKATNLPYASDIYTAGTNRTVISFGVPVTNIKGSIVGYVVGNTTPESMVDSINLDDINSYYMTVTDSEGNILISENHAPDSIINISSTESTFRKLSISAKTTAQETNYLDDEVFTIGQKISPKNSNSNVFVFSYYDRENYQSKLDSIKDQSASFYYNVLGIFNMAWVVSASVIILIIKNRYDKKT